jgi:hypothetical protein
VEVVERARDWEEEERGASEEREERALFSQLEPPPLSPSFIALACKNARRSNAREPVLRDLHT